MKPVRFFSLIVFVFLVISELFPTGVQNMALYMFLLWIVLSWIEFPGVFKESLSEKRYVYLLLFLVFFFLSTTFGKNLFQGFVYTLYMMRVVSPILMYDIIRKCDKKTQRLFVSTIIIVFVFYAFWMYSIVDIYGAELGLKNSILGTDSEERVNSAFGYIYSLPIIITTTVLSIRHLFNNRHANGSKWLSIVVLLSVAIYFFVLVFKSLFMTATILSIFGVCLGFFYHNGKHWVIKCGVAILLLSFVFIVMYENISSNVSQLGSTSTDQRVEEIFFLLTGKGSQAQDISSRGDLSNVSIKTFLKYPIFGANHLAGHERYNNNLIGNHAEWFDLLALYGVFAFFLFYVIITSLKRQYKDKGSNVPAIMYILTGLLNPMFCLAVNVAVFVIAPLISPTLLKKGRAI